MLMGACLAMARGTRPCAVIGRHSHVAHDQSRALPARFLVAFLLLAGLCGLGAAPSAHAQTVTALQDTTCARDRAGALNCTANDFTVGATLANGPGSPPSCVAGSMVTVEVDLSLTSNSPSRYDVGFFVGQSGNSPTSAGGQCSVATFPELPLPWVDLDLQAGDTCGDFLGPSQSATPRIQSVKLICQGDATTGELLVPYTLVYSQNGTAVCAGPANVVPGTSAKCQSGTARVSTFVVNGYVDVTKQTLPDGDTTSFGFTSSGSVTTAPTSFNLTDNNTQRVTMAINGSARQLTVDENVPAHWRSTISCSSGTVDTSGQANGTLVATLQNSSPNAACTVTNTKRSRITIQKDVGGRVLAADQFNVSVSGAGSSTLTNTSDVAITAAGAGIATSGTGTGVTAANTFFATPGQTLTLTDAMAAGSSSLLSQYDTRLTCTNAFTGSGATGSLPSNQSTSSFSLTPAPGDDITCTYSNTPQPRLSLQKAIALPGRSAGTDQFALTISGTGGPASVTTTGAGTSVTSAVATLTGTAGAAYTLSEAAAGTTNLALYDSSISCSNANAGSGTVLPSGSGTSTSFGVTPANNDDISCTITNGRKSASLRLAKAWSNAAVNDIASLSSTGLINNASLNSIANAASETDTGATVTVYAGETATLAEVLDGGNSGQYSASAWSCSGGTLTGNSVAINAADAGTTITCTITNTRATRTVTVAKSLSPSGDSGKFTLQINSNPVAIDVGNGGSGSTVGVPVGSTVNVAEIAGTGTVLADYVSSLSCSGVSGVSGTTTGSFTLPDNDVTCTFTNTRNTATLTLTKTVVNDNGGTTLATAWTLSASGPTPISGATGSAAVTNATVDLGTYTLAESGPGDYLQTGLACSGAADTNPSDGLTLAAGEAVSCQFTNDDQAASLTLAKSAAVTDTNGNTVTGDAGDTITYTFSATNTGTVTLAPVTVSDPLLPTLGCTLASLAPGATASCAATNNTYVITAADVTAGNVVNTATATGDAPGTMTDPTATDSATVTTAATPTASLTLAKSASVADTNGNLVTGDAGDTITYTFSATNTGTVTLAPVTVADPLLPSLSCAIASLAPAATASCAATNNTYVITAADVTAGNVVNTATATGDAPGTIVDPTATDTATTPTSATPTASLTLAKSASVADTNGNLVTGDAGDTITYTFSATNTGTVALAPVTVTDPLLPSLSCTIASLAPSATASCAATNNTYVITAADVTAGNVVNTATATGDAPGSIVDPTATDTATTPTAATPTASLTLAKSASVADTNGNLVTGDAGDTSTYTFSATNTGTVALAPVTVADPLLPTLSCTLASLAPGATASCTATNSTYVITAADVTAGNVVNTATATGDAPGTIADPTATDTVTTPTAATPTASVVLTKSASVADTNGNTVTGDAGDTVTYTFSVENTGTVTLAPVTVADPLLPSLTCAIATLAPGATASCAATNNTYVIQTSDVGGVTNTATVTGDAPGTIPDPSDSDTASTPEVATPTASLTLDKSAAVADTNGNLVTGDAGDTITYTFSATNTGTVTLASVTVADPLLPSLSCTIASLAPAATDSCAATNSTYVITAADVTAGSVVNTATATGDAPGSIVDPTATDTATTSTAATPTASLTLAKSASVADTNGNLVTGDAGDTITYTFSATNTGTVTLAPVTVTDPLLPSLSCTIASLAPAATAACAATNNTYVITAADVTAGSVVNTATATGDAPGTIVDPTATDTVTTPTAATPTASLTLTKSASVADTNGNLVTGDAGDTITYSFSVENTGTVTLAPVTISDPLLPGLSCTIASLAPAATAACAATNNTYVITAADVTSGSVVNTATATGDAPGTIADPTTTDTATTSTSATPTASLTLAKSAFVVDTNGNLVTGDAGDTITYTFSATNTGTVTLAPVTVADPLLPTLGCTIASLAPAATASCAATNNTYVITAADVTAGNVVNTATATGDAPGTIPDPTATDTATVTTTAAPTASLVLTKSAVVADTNGNLVTGDAGDTITYAFSVENTGTVTLAPVTVADPLLPSLSCTITTLAPGATASCAATGNTYVIQASDVGGVTNTATATGDAPGTIPDPSDSDSVSTPEVATPTASLTLDKSATVADTNGNLVTGDAGDVITYTFSATNTGTVTLAPVTVTDPLLPSLSCTLASLAPSATASCTPANNTYVITAADVTAGNVVNTATATGDAPGTIVDPTATDTATTSTAATPTASLTLAKSASVADTNGNLVTGDAGDTITYTFSATNTGTVTLAPVTVTDALLPSLTCSIASLTPSATASCAATNNTYVITAADVTAGNVVNTATATGDAPGSIVDPSATDTVTTPTASTPTASLTLTKSASVADTNGNTVTGDAGDTITYTFSVENTGTVTLAPVTVADPLLPTLGCTLASLAPAATASCTATNNTYVITAADVTAGSVVNTATATGDAPGTIVDPTATDTVTTPTAATPTASLTLTKSASVADTNGNTVTGDAGDTITYSFSVENTGTVTLTPVTVADPLLPSLTCTIATLAPGATASCAATNNTHVIQTSDVGGVTNTATATGDAPGTIPDPSDSDTASTPEVATPTASLTLAKSASVADTNGNLVTGDAGDTITYTFSATNTGTVTLAPVTVTDPLLPSLSCTLASLAPSATASCTPANNTYVITAADVTAGSVVNTATATGDAPGSIVDPTATDTATTSTAATPTASLTLAKSASVADTNGNLVTGDAGDTITYTFSATNTGTVTLAPVTVTDPLLPSLTCTIASLAPAATAACAATNNTYVITAADVTAGSVVNTATATGDAPGTIVDPTATDTVTTPTAATPTASLTLTKSASVADTNGNLVTGDAGDTITYTFSVTNTGTVTLAPVTVADPLLPSLTCTIASLAPAATASCAATGNTYVIQAGDVGVTNTATATGDAPGTIPDPSDSDTVSTPEVATPTASLTLAKSASVADTNGNLVTGDAGDTITYTFSATNTGTVTLAPVTVADPLLPSLSCTIASLAPSATVACTATNNTYVITVADVTAGNVVNTATATGDAPGSIVDPTATDTATTSTSATPTASLTLGKSASVADTNGNLVTGDAGDTITYTFSATNTGTVTLAPVTVTDALLPSLTCTIATLAPGATASCVATNNTYVITAADVTAGNVVNTATATGDAPGSIADPTATDTATTPTTDGPVASVVLTKSASVADTNGNTVTGDAGDTITYTFSVENTGTVTLAPVTVADPLLPSLTCTIASLAPAATASCAATGNTYTIQAVDVPAGVTNTATATGDAPGTIVDPSDSDTVTTPTAATPVVSLSVIKAVPTNADNDGSGSVTINDVLTYTITATNTGDITLTDVVVSDPQLTPSSITCASLVPAATCVLTGTHTVVQTDVDAGAIVNTATADSAQTSSTSSNTVTTSVAVVSAIDPTLLRLVKQAAQREVKSGDLVRYTVTVENVGASAAANATLVDTPPAGFTYVDGSLVVDDDNDTGMLTGTNPLRISGIDIAVGGRATIVYYLRVGAGVGKGVHLNSVSAIGPNGDPISNVATAEVDMAGDPLLDDSLILGTVFDDRDGDGRQDEGERGIPGVRIASVEGLIMETDAYGRYHLAGVPAGDWSRGRNFILKVDAATLPPGSQFTTENPRVRRITPGIPVRFDFGVRLPEGEIGPGKSETDIELGEVLFEAGSATVKPEYAPLFANIAGKLREYDGGRVTITAQAEAESIAFARASAVQAELAKQLSPELAAKTQIDVAVGTQTVVSLDAAIRLGEVLFDTDKATIKPAYRDLIREIAATLNREGRGVIGVIGRADPRGANAYNVQLGLRRAKAVFEAIAAELTPEVRQKVRVDITDDPNAAVGVGDR